MEAPLVSEGCIEVRVVRPEDLHDEGSGEDVGKDHVADDKMPDTEEKQYLELNMINYTLVRCDKEPGDNENAEYQLVPNAGNTNCDDEENGDTVYVLQPPVSSEAEVGGETHYVVMDQQQPAMDANYQQEPLYVMRYEHENEEEESNEDDTSAALLAQVIHNERLNYHAMRKTPSQKLDRRRKNKFPDPQTLLSSPNFKLFLYTCKTCDFKCNAIQELRDHKKTEHPGKPGTRAWKPAAAEARALAGGGARAAKAPRLANQCPVCGFQAHSPTELKKHILKLHTTQNSNSDDDDEPDRYRCAICKFECHDLRTFDRHSSTH